MVIGCRRNLPLLSRPVENLIPQTSLAWWLGRFKSSTPENRLGNIHRLLSSIDREAYGATEHCRDVDRRNSGSRNFCWFLCSRSFENPVGKQKGNHPGLVMRIANKTGKEPQMKWVRLTMKQLLILLLGFAFTCSVRATMIADEIVKGLPVQVVSPSRSYKVFEQYPWEGRSSKYGPKGNRLNSSYGVGVGKNIRRSLRVRQGDWIHIPDIGWRQINESSSKSDGIEFFASRRDEYKSRHPRVVIDKVVFALPSQQPVHAPARLAGPVPTSSWNLSSSF
jgi:hypothetical protein